MALLPMQVFVDESGAFDWSNVGMSVLAAVGVAEHDGTHRQLVSRLRHWERSLPRGRREGGEVKGRLVTDDELAGFVRYVLDRNRSRNHVSLCGFDSTRTSRTDVARFRSQLCTSATPEFLRYAAAGKPRSARKVRELIGWLGGRSEQQVAWLVCLQAVLAMALQHAVIAQMDGEDRELGELRFVIDRSWITNPRHVDFWHNVLNSGLNDRSRRHPLALPRHWQPTHAFRRAYDRDAGLDLRALWRMTKFLPSHEEPGVRVADVVAQIAYRHFRHGKAAQAFAALEPFIMGEHGTLLTVIAVTPRADLSPSPVEA